MLPQKEVLYKMLNDKFLFSKLCKFSLQKNEKPKSIHFSKVENT